MPLRYVSLLLFGLLSLFPLHSEAQELEGRQADSLVPGSDQLYFWEYSQYPRYIHFKIPQTGFYANPTAFLRKIYTLDDRFTFTETKKTEDHIGQIHVRFQVNYMGYPVDGAMIGAHLQNTTLLALDAALFTLPEQKPAVLPEEVIIRKVLEDKPSRAFMWNIPGEDALLKDLLNDENAGYYPQPELTWFPQYPSKPDSNWVLSYRMKVYSAEPLFHDQVYVRADDGSILFRENLLHDINTYGTAVTKYSGTQTIRVDSLGNGLYRLRDSSLGARIQTFDLNKSTSYAGAVDFIDSNNYWDNLNAQQDEVATDAHWGAEKTYQYFYTNFNRQSFDNQGATIRSYVHYSNNYNNAFWNGYYMTYGDGNGTTFTPLTSLDVCGHEIGHAVTTHTANLIYQNESGALNESFSDIFGNSIEFENKSTASWKIGEEITPNGSGLRNMQKPKLKGDPDTYKGQYWYSGSGDNGGVHTNSGVQNYWYYALCEGDTGTNDKGKTYAVDSLGRPVTQQIVYRSLSIYLTRFSNYTDARYFSILAAKDLYGRCSKEVIATTNAWYAAGVGDEFDSSTVTANFSSDDFRCFSPSVISFLNYSENARSYLWDFGDGTQDTLEQPIHTYASYGFFDVSLIAYNCYGTGSDTLIKSEQILIDSTADICHALVLPDNGRSQSTYCRGFIYDDGGESVYSDMLESYLTITTPEADSIAIVFLEFDYEANYDYLYLYQGHDSDGILLGQYSGTNLPNNGDTVFIQGNTITLHHSSDPAVVGTGFKLFYQGYRRDISLITPPDGILCSGDSLLMTPQWQAPDSTSLVFYWLDSSSLQTQNIGKQVWLKPDTSQSFALVLFDACQLISDTAWFRIEVREPLATILAADTLVCHLQNSQLIASGSGGLPSGYSFYWPELGLSGSAVNIAFETDTLLHVVLSDGCTSLADTAAINFRIRKPLSVILSGDTVLCPDDIGSFEVQAFGGDSLNYLVYWNHDLSPEGFTKQIPHSWNNWVHVSLDDQCSLLPGEDSIFMRSIPEINHSLTNDTTLCYGQSIDLQLNLFAADFATLGFSWNMGGIADDSTYSTDPIAAGNYLVSISDRCSLLEDSVRVTLYDPLSFLPETDTAVCFAESLYKNLDGSGGLPASYSFLWIDGFTGKTRTWTPTATSAYQVILDDGCSLPDTTSFTVMVREPLSLELGPDLIVCDAKSYLLKANSGGGLPANYIYYWNSLVKPDTARFTAKNPIWHKVRLSDGCSPDVFDSIFVDVQVPPLPAISISDTFICTGQEIQVGISDPVNKISWRCSDGSIFTTSTWINRWSIPGDYSLEMAIENLDGCTVDTLIENAVTVVQAATADIYLEKKAMQLDEAELLAESLDSRAVFWQWSLSDGGTYTGSVLEHRFRDTGTYFIRLYVEDMAGCSDQANDTVTVYDKAIIWLPTAFTPNNDIRNDWYQPVFLNLESGEYRIYDRWGALIYHCRDIHHCRWSGLTDHGTEAPGGVYMLIFEGMSKQGERLLQNGTLLIIR